jgi:hypothetical protein
MIHISAKHGVVGVPARDDITNLFPDAKRITLEGNDLALVRHGIDETRLLRNLGFDVPAPVLIHYDWSGGEPYDVQKRTVALLTMNRRAYVLNGMGCVDADTEYLSPTGWRRIADYSEGEVAQYHPKSGEIEFVQPTKFVKLPCPEMIRFKTTRGVDQLLSPEHRVLLADGRVLQAEDIEANYGSRASRDYKFRTTFQVSGRSGVKLTDAEIRLQVAVNADGYERSDWYKVTFRLKKPRKIERLRQLLTSAGKSFRETPCAPAGFVKFTFVPPMKKGFGDAWWSCTQQQLEVVADELVHWDGSKRKAEGRAFSSFTKSDADFAQYAFSAAGCRSSLNSRPNKGGVEHVVHASAGKPDVGLYGVSGGRVRRNVWREPSTDGFKYCFMVPSTFLLLRRNGMIFATGNTGKTKAALWAWHYLYKRKEAKKLLVVAPLSTLNFTWGREIFQTIPGTQVQVLHGTRQKRLKCFADDTADVYIINHDGLKIIAPELEARDDIDTLILDELAIYRNGQSARTKLVRKVAEKMKWAWGLTGSPTPNAPTDAWAQCTILTPDSVPKYFRRFQDEVMTKITQFKYVPKPDALDKVHAVMQPAVRFTLDDVVELPDLVERTIDIDMGKKQEKVYKQMEEHAFSLVDSKEITAVNAGVVLNKLLQISTGYVYGKDKAVVALDNEERLTATVDIIESTDRKVIVFVPFVHAIEGIEKRLTSEGYDVRTISGATPKGKREEAFNLFQNTDKVKVLLAHPQTMSHGLTLTAADTILWFAPITSLETFIQANARIRRVGQKHKQQIIMLQATKVEKRMYAKLRAKEKVMNTLLDMYEEQSR